MFDVASIVHHGVHGSELELFPSFSRVALALAGHSHSRHQHARWSSVPPPPQCLLPCCHEKYCEESYLFISLPIFGVISLGLIPRSRMNRSKDTYCSDAHLSPLAQPPAVCWKDTWFQLKAWSFLIDSSCRNGGTPEALTMFRSAELPVGGRGFC